MYHSVTFSDIDETEVYTENEANSSGRSDLAGMLKGHNTWYDWHMIPTSRPTIEHPEVTLTYLKIPGRHGALDLTNYLSTKPTMADRTGSFEFYIVEDYGDRTHTRIAVVNAIHGKRMKMSFEDDPEAYYIARLAIKSWKNDKMGPYLTIDYHASPYKYDLSGNIIEGDL